mmetsp:Transcript_141898/g.441157  ORF Transcript_141898/g.441157 Transcript_141898/m.441157 type:complete len:452 (-) Transcript_141898:57-1412(-)
MCGRLHGSSSTLAVAATLAEALPQGRPAVAPDLPRGAEVVALHKVWVLLGNPRHQPPHPPRQRSPEEGVLVFGQVAVLVQRVPGTRLEEQQGALLVQPLHGPTERRGGAHLLRGVGSVLQELPQQLLVPPGRRRHHRGAAPRGVGAEADQLQGRLRLSRGGHVQGHEAALRDGGHVEVGAVGGEAAELLDVALGGGAVHVVAGILGKILVGAADEGPVLLLAARTLLHLVFLGSETNAFPSDQGHCSVSSFGFGGTNGHVIYWGCNVGKQAGSVKEKILRRMRKMAPPEVRPLGDNPDEWESDLPAADVKPGDKFVVRFASDDPADAPIRWERQEAVGDADDDDEDAFFAITGNFNGWEDDRMAPGDVPGQHVTTVTVPAGGVLEFRFLRDGDPEKVVCPGAPNCSRRCAPVIGPEAGLTNSWVVREEEDTEVQVEVLCLKGKHSVLWFKA